MPLFCCKGEIKNQNDTSNSNIKWLAGKTNADFALVMNAYMNESNIIKPNAAIFTTDKELVDKYAEFFLAKQKWNHSCGYDYSILFGKNKTAIIDETSFNTECEVFSYKPKEALKTMNDIKDVLASNPTHYIYDIFLDKNKSARELISQGEDKNLNMFFIDDSLSRYPGFTIHYRHSTFIGQDSPNHHYNLAEDKNRDTTISHINKILSNEAVDSNLIYKSEIGFPSYGISKPNMTHLGSVSIRLKPNANFEMVMNEIESNGAKIMYIKKPTEYSIQVVDTCKTIKCIENKLSGVNVVKRVEEYNGNKSRIANNR